MLTQVRARLMPEAPGRDAAALAVAKELARQASSRMLTYADAPHSMLTNADVCVGCSEGARETGKLTYAHVC